MGAAACKKSIYRCYKILLSDLCILYIAFYPKTDILNLSKEREEMSMRKVKYVLSNGVITESYKVAKSYDVPFRVTLETVPETPIRLTEKRKAIRKVVK